MAPPGSARRPPLPRVVNLFCFLATVVTTLVAGTLLTIDDHSWATLCDIFTSPSYWSLGLPYSLSILLILGTHEMGHYVACRLYGIEATLPFFIPSPFPFGTFGAVIRIRSPFTTRRALFDVGIAGPIAGFIVAVPVLLLGLSLSTIARQPPRADSIPLGGYLLTEILGRLFFGGGGSASIDLHPVYVAGWVGLLATSLNLMPLGQLDGGHVLYSLSPRVHRAVSRFGSPALIVVGLSIGGYHLVTFGILFAILGLGHPPTLQEGDRLGSARVLVAAAALLIFILCFIPVPIPPDSLR